MHDGGREHAIRIARMMLSRCGPPQAGVCGEVTSGGRGRNIVLSTRSSRSQRATPVFGEGSETMPIRVVHCGSGLTGREALRAIIQDPALELVGQYVSTAGKVGKDAGELCGLQPTGVIATGDLDAVAARPGHLAATDLPYDVTRRVRRDG
jgi:hypothetical protein